MSPTTEHNPWPPKSTQMASVPQPADNATTELSTQMASIPQPVDNATIKLGTREFCAFGVQNNINCVPVDDVSSDFGRTTTSTDPEQAEDDLFNTFHRYLSDHDILPTVPPKFLPKTDEPQVLDCGYGTGIWIEELLDMDAYTKSEVTGVDIFIRPRPGVQEFYKEQWNLNAPMQTKKFRLPSNHFDLINSRFLVDGVDERRWDLLVMEYKELLKPKAWLQMAEVEWIFHSQSNRHLPALEIWSGAYNSALAIMQKKPNVAADGWLEWLVRFKGFQQVNGSIHNIPIEEWRAGATNYTLLFTSH
ncbi:hypothetical protein MBLNU13_g00024t2 [Cladosporium sp. NU13]